MGTDADKHTRTGTFSCSINIWRYLWHFMYSFSITFQPSRQSKRPASRAANQPASQPNEWKKKKQQHRTEKIRPKSMFLCLDVFFSSAI